MSNESDAGLSTQHSALTSDSAIIPDWCEWGRGDSAILLVAPHGGRRPPVDPTAPPRELRVNDVKTPEITRELAAALDAGVIINTGMDRNTLDLNRISQVRRHAAWFLALLTREIELIVQRHGQLEVVFIHGWNTGQATCDIGIGGSATATGLHVPDGSRVTVSDSYLRNRIHPLCDACERAGIRASIGARYPGSHRNNMLQLFTARAAEIDDPQIRRIASWVAEGRINALQLELSIPLRWPGVWRDRFIDAAAEAFGEKPKSYVASLKADPIVRAGTPDLPAALQFYDPVADVGMFAGVGPTGAYSLGARLLLFLGGQRIALFTGEGMRADGHVAPLALAADGDAMHLDFRGPMLLLDDAAIYLDLEAAFAGSRLVEGHIDLHFQTHRWQGAEFAKPVQFGSIEGRVAIDRRERRVDVGAVANAGPLRASGARQQTMIAAHFGPQRALLSRAVEGQGTPLALHFTAGALRPLDDACLSVSTDGDVYTPNALSLRCNGHAPVQGQPLSRMAILRPAGHGAYLRVTFGVARFQWGDAQGYGLYEHARPVGTNSPPAPLLGREG